MYFGKNKINLIHKYIIVLNLNNAITYKSKAIDFYLIKCL